LLKNGGGKKEDLIKQIGDIIDRIHSIEQAAAYGSHGVMKNKKNTN